ncbi:VOC family protein [Kribbella sp. NPDC056951]|uniref:VOC family protein n=1 Tax=Kribbella sp. NPDC056951 TaxID=3345978 RepID=UPI003640054F
MERSVKDESHRNLHSEYGAVRGEHPGRVRNPVIKVEDLAWLEFEKPDLDRAERFARAFGFGVAARTSAEVQLRGSRPGAPCVLIRRGPRSRFAGLAFSAADPQDVLRLAEVTGSRPQKLPDGLGGIGVELRDPSGARVRVVSGVHVLPEIPSESPPAFNFGSEVRRTNATQRPARLPVTVERLGHVVLQSTTFRETLDWYLKHLGLIVSDFLYHEGRRDRGPVMGFVRCDRGTVATDHHTIALTLGPRDRYVHSAYQVSDLDALAAGGEYLLDQGYRRSWGIGRHIQGSQIFDYWRDPDGFLVEHFTDGDLFDNTLEPGWAPMTVSGLAQWGPSATKDFLGIGFGRETLGELGSIASALRSENEFDLARLRGLLKVAAS